MPVHDWSRVDRSLFHSFTLGWLTRISGRLNAGVLPTAYFAMCETLREPDRPIFLELPEPARRFEEPGQPGERRFYPEDLPQTWLHIDSDQREYAEKVITIRHCDHHQPVAAIRIMSPDNKRGRYRFASFVGWAVEVIRVGFPLLLVDLFPPTPHEPQGIHKAIWDEFMKSDFALPPDRPLTLAAYRGNPCLEAFIEPAAVGGSLAEMPLFLPRDEYVLVPLEATYQAEWAEFPLKELFEGQDSPQNP
jgi:hypothetical protein